MRAVVQRVSRASVIVDLKVVASIDKGLLVLLGVKDGDRESDADYLAERCARLRVFSDDAGKMNVSAVDSGASVLVVSQFTLYGDTRRGHRPSFTDAADPQTAERLYERFTSSLRTLLGPQRVATGVFRSTMNVELINDGPVTLIVDSPPNG